MVRAGTLQAERVLRPQGHTFVVLVPTSSQPAASQQPAGIYRGTCRAATGRRDGVAHSDDDRHRAGPAGRGAGGQLIASAGVGAAFGWFFAVRSSSELRDQAERLRLATGRVLLYLDARRRGVDVEVGIGPDGEITLHSKVGLSGEQPAATGDLTWSRVDPPSPPD